MGPNFSLIRFETSGAPVWFKAVGAPNLREFAITSKLAELHSPHLPLVVALHNGWNGCLMLDGEGSHLDEVWEFEHWRTAAASLGRLQLESLPHCECLIGAGCDDRPGAIKQGQFRQIETIIENPDAEPDLPCPNTKTAIIVFGKHVGKTLTVCTDLDCPVHDPRAAAKQTATPAPAVVSAPEGESEGEAEERQRENERRAAEYEEEQQRRAEERKQQFERQQQEFEAERIRKEELHQQRVATFDRILTNAPAVFTAAQLRVFLHALITINPYTFADDVAEHFIGDDENNQQTAEEILLTTLHTLADDKLTGFGLRLVLTGRENIPAEGELDLLPEAEAAFVPAKPEAARNPKKAKSESTGKTPAKSTPSRTKKVA